MKWLKGQFWTTVEIFIPVTLIFVALTGVGFLARNIGRVTGWLSART